MVKRIKKIRRRRRICKNCNELYMPDYRNRYHQRYCSKPECRSASKKYSQEKWVSSDKGKEYFKGAKNVAHVQAWRNENPGYWKRGAKKKNTLQDYCSLEHLKNQTDSCDLNSSALQDISFSQLPLLLGFISHLTGNALQDDIVNSAQQFIQLGHDILGIDSSTIKKGMNNEKQKNSSPQSNSKSP